MNTGVHVSFQTMFFSRYIPEVGLMDCEKKVKVLVTQLCPALWDPIVCLWNSPGRNTGVGCHSLLQGVFPTQGLSMRLLHWQTGSLHHLGSPKGCLKGARPSKWVRHHHLCLASLRQAGLGRSFMEEKREGSMCALLGGCFGGKLEVATNCRRDILMG